MAFNKGMRVMADPTKQGWENSDFPIVCESCLGDNPYVRMTREQFGSTCKVCERPFTVFKWKPGAKARFKSTVTCQMCAKLKNTCQVCILDLQYGLPVEVRDRVLQQAAAAVPGTALALTAGSSGGPSADMNRSYAMAKAEASLEAGGVVPYSGAAGITPAAHEALLRLNRNRANYARNAPKLCSFFARGECGRGAECPYRHEMPKDKDDPLAKQNYKDRYYGTDDPVAAKLLGRMAERGGSGPAGFEDVPEATDPTAATVWVGGIEEGGAGGAQESLRSALYSYGEIRSVFLPKDKGCAFVEFGNHEQAQAALRGTRGALLLGPLSLVLRWAKKAQAGDKESRLYGAAADPNAGLMPVQQRATASSSAAAFSAPSPSLYSSGPASGVPQSSSAAAAAPYAPPAQPPSYSIAPWAAAMGHGAAAAPGGVAAPGAGGAPFSYPAYPYPYAPYPGGPYPGAASPGAVYPMMMMMPPPGGVPPAFGAPVVGMGAPGGGGGGPVRGGGGGRDQRAGGAHPYSGGGGGHHHHHHAQQQPQYPSTNPNQQGAAT